MFLRTNLEMKSTQRLKESRPLNRKAEIT